jgi:hypothetical protein
MQCEPTASKHQEKLPRQDMCRNTTNAAFVSSVPPTLPSTVKHMCKLQRCNLRKHDEKQQCTTRQSGLQRRVHAQVLHNCCKVLLLLSEFNPSIAFCCWQHMCTPLPPSPFKLRAQHKQQVQLPSTVLPQASQRCIISLHDTFAGLHHYPRHMPHTQTTDIVHDLCNLYISRTSR